MRNCDLEGGGFTLQAGDMTFRATIVLYIRKGRKFPPLLPWPSHFHFMKS